MKHVFVFDPKAFFNQQWKMDNILDGIGQFFRTQEKVDFSIQFSRYRRNAMAIINDETEKSNKVEDIRIYAIGGEEIFYDCLNAVSHFHAIQLASVPYGETNDFLWIFGKDKTETFKDIPALVKSGSLPTDVIRWGVNYALNFCCVGIKAVVSKNVTDLKTKVNRGRFPLISRFLAYLYRFLVAFDKESAAQKYEIAVDDAKYSGQFSLIHIANIPYYAGRPTGLKEATPNDGLLDIALIKASNPFGTLSAIRKFSNGKKPKNGIFLQGKKISIQCINQMWFQLDNEFILDTNISLSVVHNAVQIVAAPGLSYPIGSISAL